MNLSSYSFFPSKNKHLYKLSITYMHFCNWIFQLFFCAAVIVPFVTLPALPPIVIYVNIWFYVKIWKYEFMCHFPNLINRRVSMCVIMWNKSTPSPHVIVHTLHLWCDISIIQLNSPANVKQMWDIPSNVESKHTSMIVLWNVNEWMSELDQIIKSAWIATKKPQ